MPARRPEIPGVNGIIVPRGAARIAAAGWLLGAAAGLILLASPPACRAAGEESRKAPATAATKGSGTSAVAASEADSVAPAPATGKPPAATAAPAGRPGATTTSPAGKPATATAPRTPRAGAKSSPATGTAPGRLAAAAATRGRGVQSIAHLDQKLTYQYNALGRRDPFQPMIGGEFVGSDVGGDAPVDVGGMKVVGIVWGTEDKFAMAEDGRGQSLVLRVGDKVMNGVVEGLRRDAVVVRITSDGQTQSVAIPLTRKGDKSNATR